jgi:hypothetical protein
MIQVSHGFRRRKQEGRAMTDATTEKRLSVSTDGDAGPYIEVLVSQLDDLRYLLDRRGVRYSVQEDVISFDGGPEVAVVDLGRGADGSAVQAILDSEQ